MKVRVEIDLQNGTLASAEFDVPEPIAPRTEPVTSPSPVYLSGEPGLPPGKYNICGAACAERREQVKKDRDFLFLLMRKLCVSPRIETRSEPGVLEEFAVADHNAILTAVDRLIRGFGKGGR